MIKYLIVGLWGSAVALGATYTTAMMSAGTSVAIEAPTSKVDGLEVRRPAAITVPMIKDGKLRGYVVTRVVYTAKAQMLKDFTIDPEPFVLDEAFRRIYTDGKIEFDQMSKYNLDAITKAVRTNVNERIGLELIEDVLMDELTYVRKDAIDQGTEVPEALSGGGGGGDHGGKSKGGGH